MKVSEMRQDLKQINEHVRVAIYNDLYDVRYYDVKYKKDTITSLKTTRNVRTHDFEIPTSEWNRVRKAVEKHIDKVEQDKRERKSRTVRVWKDHGFH